MFLVVLFLFSGAICYLGCSSVPGQGLDSCVVVWFSFFVAVLVGAFVALLVAVLVFALCSWGPAPGLVLAWSFQFLLVAILVVVFCIWWNIDDCQTILTFQHVISSLCVYANAILNKVRKPLRERTQTAWQRDWRLASRRHSSCLATAWRSVLVNDRVWPSIVVWSKCVLQYFCWAWSWVGFAGFDWSQWLGKTCGLKF